MRRGSRHPVGNVIPWPGDVSSHSAAILLTWITWTPSEPDLHSSHAPRGSIGIVQRHAAPFHTHVSIVLRPSRLDINHSRGPEVRIWQGFPRSLPLDWKHLAASCQTATDAPFGAKCDLLVSRRVDQPSGLTEDWPLTQLHRTIEYHLPTSPDGRLEAGDTKTLFHGGLSAPATIRFSVEIDTLYHPESHAIVTTHRLGLEDLQGHLLIVARPKLTTSIPSIVTRDFRGPGLCCALLHGPCP